MPMETYGGLFYAFNFEARDLHNGFDDVEDDGPHLIMLIMMTSLFCKEYVIL